MIFKLNANVLGINTAVHFIPGQSSGNVPAVRGNDLQRSGIAAVPHRWRFGSRSLHQCVTGPRTEHTGRQITGGKYILADAVMALNRGYLVWFACKSRLVSRQIIAIHMDNPSGIINQTSLLHFDIFIQFFALFKVTMVLRCDILFNSNLEIDETVN